MLAYKLPEFGGKLLFCRASSRSCEMLSLLVSCNRLSTTPRATLERLVGMQISSPNKYLAKWLPTVLERLPGRVTLPDSGTSHENSETAEPLQPRELACAIQSTMRLIYACQSCNVLRKPSRMQPQVPSQRLAISYCRQS